MVVVVKKKVNILERNFFFFFSSKSLQVLPLLSLFYHRPLHQSFIIHPRYFEGKGRQKVRVWLFTVYFVFYVLPPGCFSRSGSPLKSTWQERPSSLRCASSSGKGWRPPTRTVCFEMGDCRYLKVVCPRTLMGIFDRSGRDRLFRWLRVSSFRRHVSGCHQ